MIKPVLKRVVIKTPPSSLKEEKSELYRIIEELRLEYKVSEEVAKATVIKVRLKDAINKKVEELARKFNISVGHADLPPETPMGYFPAENKIKIDLENYAWSVCEIVQNEPRLNWDMILEAEFHHEIGEKVLIEKVGLFKPRDRFEEILAHLTAHQWIDKFFLPPELRKIDRLIYNAHKKKLSIPELRRDLEGPLEDFIEAVYAILSYFSSNEIKVLFPEVPELAKMREELDKITSPQEARRVYDKWVSRWRELGSSRKNIIRLFGGNVKGNFKNS